MEDIVGSIAAFLTTFCFVPQVAKAVTTRNTEGISLAMYILFTLGISFWLAYGLMIERLPIIVSNTVTLGLVSIILWVKIREDYWKRQ